MRKILSYLGWTAVALGVLLLIAVVGIGLFSQTERFRVLLREQLVSALNASFRGDVSLGRIEGSLWGNLTLYDFVLQYQGTEVLRVPKLTARYALLPLLRGVVHVLRVEGVEPLARVKQDAEGRWNIVEAFAAETEQPEEPTTEEGGLTVLLDTVVLQNAHAEITPAGEGAGTYRLEAINLDASVEVLPSGLAAQVRHLGSQVLAEGLPQLQVATALTYEGTRVPESIDISIFTLDTPHSHVRLSGEVVDLKTFETNAELSIKNLATVDLLRVVPDWPLTPDLSGTAQVDGTLADLRGTLTLAAADAQMNAQWQADLSQEVPQYAGTVKILRFNMQELVREQNLAGVVEGTIRAKGVGTAIADLTGEADLQVQALRVGDWQIGNVEMNGSLAQARGKLRGKVTGDLGHATWQGEATLTEEPRYELAVSVERLDMKRVAPGEEPMASDINLTGRVQGQGLDLQTMTAQTEITLLPSTMGPVEAQQGRLAASIAGGRVQLSEVSLVAQDATLTAQGGIGISPEEQGQLTYSLQVANLSPWLSLAGQQGSGALRLAGEAQGNLANLRVQGELQAQAVQVGENAVQSGTVSFNLSNLGQQPHGVLNAALRGVHAGVDLQTAEATVTLPQDRSPPDAIVARVSARARSDATRTHRLQAEASYRPEQTTVRLSDLSLDLPVGTWQLSQPTRVAYEQPHITVDQLLVTSRDQQILVDGRLALSGPQDLRVQVERLALATLQPLLPPEPPVQGILSTRVQISGTANAPHIVASAGLGNLQIAGQNYERLSAAVTYREKRAAGQISFQQDAAHTLTATGELPLILSWAEGWNAQVAGDINARMRSDGLNLAFLNAFSGEAVEEIAGELRADITLDGPVTRPRARGTVQVRDGQAQVPPLGVHISAIGVEVQIDEEQLRIEQITAQAQDGRLQGSGVIALQDYMPQRFSLALSADQWPAIDTRQYKVEIDGQMRGEGPLTAPQITGRLEVPSATLQPELALLEGSVVKRDETIVVRQEQEAAPETAENGTSPPTVQNGAMQQLGLDLTVVLPRNTWVRHQNANIELAGEVRIKKETGGDPSLVGTIGVVRGWMGFQGRRFTLTEGRIVFAGEPEINPNLSIVAQYQFPDYDVAVEVGGTAKNPTLTLRSEPELEQADILSLLIFGRPTHALTEGERMDLQGQAMSIATGYVATRVAESVSQALGLEELGISIQDIDMSGGRVGIGGYVGPNTYISTSQDVSGGGREVMVEYHLTPEWKVTTSTNAEGNNAAGITWHKQY